MKPHVVAGAIQVVAQSVGISLAAGGYMTAAFVVEAIGGGATALGAYLTSQGQ